MMSLWDALRMNMMISYQELVRTFLRKIPTDSNDFYQSAYHAVSANQIGLDTRKVSVPGARIFAFLKKAG